MAGTRIRILIADDHPMFRKGLAATLSQEPDMDVVALASSGPQAMNLYRDLRPDVTIMDISMTPEMTGTEATRRIRAEFPEARIIMLTVYRGEQDIYEALSAGAAAYLLKEAVADDLPSIVRDVHCGGGPIPPEVARKLANRLSQEQLTSREVDVLKLIAEGCRNKEIAKRLGISENTTQGHVKSILLKLKVDDRAGAIAVALRRGILHIESM